MTFIASILIGLALLFAGRKLFWIVVGTIGFLVGMKLATIFFEPGSEQALILTAIAIGCLCAVLAIAVQKVAVGLAGFVAGAYGAFIIMQRIGLHPGNAGWIIILIAGVVGLVIAASIFKWALILISSLVGSYLLVTALHLNPHADSLLFLVIAMVGVLVQARSLSKPKPAGKKMPNNQTLSPEE